MRAALHDRVGHGSLLIHVPDLWRLVRIDHPPRQLQPETGPRHGSEILVPPRRARGRRAPRPEPPAPRQHLGSFQFGFIIFVHKQSLGLGPCQPLRRQSRCKPPRRSSAPAQCTRLRLGPGAVIDQPHAGEINEHRVDILLAGANLVPARGASLQPTPQYTPNMCRRCGIAREIGQRGPP